MSGVEVYAYDQLVRSSHTTLAGALVTALADLTIVEKGRSVDTGSYSYGYADLGDIVKRTRPVLAAHGLVALTPVHAHGDGLACTVTIIHESGERLDFGPFPFPHGRDAQATGSMVTYHRRYALVAALGMAAGDDDDGASAHARQAPVGWTIEEAKAHVLSLAGGDRDRAKAAWIEVYSAPWTVEGLTAAYNAWAAAEAAESVEDGSGHGDTGRPSEGVSGPSSGVSEADTVDDVIEMVRALSDAAVEAGLADHKVPEPWGSDSERRLALATAIATARGVL